jgi:NAD(P)H-hydrate epimerase
MQAMTAAHVKNSDREAARLGVATATLMQRAGEAVAAAVLNLHAQGPVAVLCGPGHNGGDGFVAAARLHAYGREVHTFATPPKGQTDWARAEWAAQHEVRPLTDFPAVSERYAVVVDALIGTGLTRPLQGALLTAVQAANAGTAVRVAADVPTGVNSDQAEPPGEAFCADVTVQLDAAKPASALEPARSLYGRWTCADIGMPKAARDPHAGELERQSILPTDAPNGHKYRRGTLLIVAGSSGMEGACRLAALGAHRRGAGLVTVATYGALAGHEAATLGPLQMNPEHPQRVLETVPEKQRQVVLVGPGLTQSDALAPVGAASRWDGHLVLDAGALHHETVETAARKPGARPWLTPHAGEAARLLGVKAEDVARDPLHAARALAERFNVGVVLKGAGTVVVDATLAWWLIEPGPPALARGGTGDVLAGTIAASLAVAPKPAGRTVARAVRAHAAAGVLAARLSGAGLTPTDVAHALPHAKSLDGVRW